MDLTVRIYSYHVHVYICMNHVLKVYKYSKMFATLMDFDTVFKTNNT